MAKISHAAAFANNEVGYIAWDLDGDISGCLGFNIVREYLDANDQIVEERPLASYVAFRGQSNPDWLAQNTTVWPIQKMSWRDLTLRKCREKAERRGAHARVRYRIRAVGDWRSGLERVVVVPESHRERGTTTDISHTYEGAPRPLGYVTETAYTNIIEVTRELPPFTAAFTNGILSTQFLSQVLKEDGEIQAGELEDHLRTPDDWLRNYLAGDVLPTIQAFFEQPGGRFHAALYELEDEQLLGFLVDKHDRLDLILSDAGKGEGGPDEDGKRSARYDTRNAAARKILRKLAKSSATFRMQDRFFNGTGHIGHNKFVVYVGDDDQPQSVLTGSTNWTWSGVSGQSNNCLRIDDPNVAAAYLAYWQRLFEDKQRTPRPLSAKATGAKQGDAIKTANRAPVRAELGNGASAEVWFSPNMPGKNAPPSKTAAASVKKPPAPPPDMDRLFSLMRKAQKAIFFLVFMPSRGGANSIVSEAMDLGLKDTSLQVIGAISDTQAMWGYEPSTVDETSKKTPAWSPHIFRQGSISVARATALTDREIARGLGDFSLDETLTLGRAIIHDKILVLDPLDPERCVVALGSHNLGYKASYANDENLLVIRGHSALAQAYMVHVLDVYDHYRFRAAEAEVSSRRKTPKAKKEARWDGFLDTTDGWQSKVSRRLARYLSR